MHNQYWLEDVRMALRMGLHEIKMIAELAELLPDCVTRMRVIDKIAEEAREAAFWNDILICYAGTYGPEYYKADNKQE